MNGYAPHRYWPDPFQYGTPPAPCSNTYLADQGYASFDGGPGGAVGHGGACCAECASGGMCVSQRRAAVGAMTAPSPTTLFLVAAVAIGGWALLGFPTAAALMRKVGM